jgi:hypothetical protein
VIGGVGLGEDLFGELSRGAVGISRGAGGQFGAVDSDQAWSQHPGPGTHREDLTEQSRDRLLMSGAEPSDGRVVGLLVGRHHPERHILDQTPFDLSAGPLADRVGVDQQPEHHRWVVRNPTATIEAVTGAERR